MTTPVTHIPADFTGLVLFSAPWCGPCKKYKPELRSYAEARGLQLLEVDASVSRELAAEHGVRSVPATLYFTLGVPGTVAMGPQTVDRLDQLVGA